MNTELLMEVRQRILDEPRQFDMDVFFESHADIPNCGTAACIAGWAIALSEKTTPKEAKNRNFSLDYEILAVRALRIDFHQANRLFYVGTWPAEFQSRFRMSVESDERAQVAAERIDHFIKTEGAE